MPDPSVTATSTSVPHVVIVGGGFGGLTAAKALRRKPVRVTLVDRQNHHLFQMLLYQVATAGLSPGDIASPIRWILRRQANTRVLMAEAQGVDVASRTLVTDVGPIAFDYLILAPGVTHSYFGHEEWRAHAPGLKTLDDALAIRAQVLLAFERAERAASAEERRRSLTFIIVATRCVTSSAPSIRALRRCCSSRVGRTCSRRFRRSCAIAPARTSSASA
jgi:NADH dehydrogenase